MTNQTLKELKLQLEELNKFGCFENFVKKTFRKLSPMNLWYYKAAIKINLGVDLPELDGSYTVKEEPVYDLLMQKINELERQLND